MYKLLATDLDGTLTNSACDIPEANIAALRAAMEKGVRVCLCSGRSHLSLKWYEALLGLDAPGNYGVSLNGSMVYETDSHRVLRDVRLENSLALGITRELRNFGADIVVYIGGQMLAQAPTEGVMAYARRSRVPVTLVDSFDSVTDEVSKVLIRGDYGDLSRAARHMLPLVAGKCNQFFTERTILEYTGLEANKGAALMFLAQSLGIAREEVIAVGDNFNDIHMLREAGLGVAVRNAEAETKEAADYVTLADNSEGALAEVVRRFL